MKKHLLNGLASLLLPVAGYAGLSPTAYQRTYMQRSAASVSALDVVQSARLGVPRDTVEQADELMLTQGQPVRELVLIDAGVQDRESLARANRPGVEVVEIAADKDGLTQLIDILAQYRNLSALHIVSHAEEGVLLLGNTRISAETLQQRVEAFSSLNGALKPGADLMLYGCDLAAGEAGEEFLDIVQRNTHLDIAASTDLTGNAVKGGDWELELARGEIDAEVPFSEKALRDFRDVLAIPGTIAFNGTNSGQYDTANAGVNATYTNSGYTLVVDGQNRSTNIGNGFSYYAMSGNNEVNMSLYLQSGQSFDATSFYLHNMSGGSESFTITSDQGDTYNAGSLNNLTGKTVTLVGFTGITKLYVTPATTSWFFVDDLAISNIQAIDNTPPTFQNSTPSISSTTTTGTTLTARLNEIGTAYYVVVADGAAAPTTTQVRNGQNGSGAAALASGQISVASAGADYTAVINTLSAGTSYDIYVVAQDDEGTPNVQAAVTLVNLTTQTTLAASPTLNFSGADAALGTAVTDGEANALDISGITFEIYSANASNTNSGAAWVYTTDVYSDGGTTTLDEGIGDNSGDGTPIVVLRTQGGTEFSFNGITVVDYLAVHPQVVFEGFRNGSSTGSVTLNTDGDFITNFTSSGLTASIFQNVDEVRLTATSGDVYAVIDNIALSTAVTTNSDANLTASAIVTEPVGLGTTIDTVGEAVDVFDFTISDGGTSDGLATTVSQIVLNVSGTSTDTERGQITWRLNGPDASNVTGTYNGAGDTLTFSGLSISVANAGSETYTVNAYYNTTTSLTEDRTIILSVDGDTNLTVGGAGTQMGSTSAVTNGTGTTVDVTATALVFTTQPAGSTSGSALSTQPVVTARDAFGNTDVDFTETVTLTEASAGSLSNNTQAAVAGVATFTSVTYTASADQQNFTLTANDQDGVGSDLATVDASAVTSNVVATQLQFSTQPSPLTASSGVALNFSTDPVVQAVDANSVVDTGYATDIVLSEVNGSGSATMTATGDTDGSGATVSITPASGVATFTNLNVTYTNSGAGAETFNLRASSGALTTADSSQLSSSSAPTVSDGNISISGASGTSGAYKIGDTVTATWNNTAGGDNNSGITGVTVDFSAFGGGAAVAASNSSETWTATFTISAGAIDGTNRNVSVTATNASGPTTTADTSNATVDNIAPTVTDGNLSISGASGTGGAFVTGDTVTATWNNTAGGDNNSDTISGATVDFSQFGGGAAVAASNSSGTWTATYTIVSGAIDATNRNISLTATDNAGNTTTTADTTNATVDNIAPTVTDGNLSISGASGSGGAYVIGDTVTASWNNTAGGDNNSDTISGATVDFSQFGGGAAVAASNSSNTWTATYTIVSGAIDTTNRNISLTATDNAGITTTTADTTNATVDNVAPTVSSVSVPSNATYVADQNLDFTINYDDNVTVDTSGGTPRLALTIGATTRYASYQSGSGTSALLFRHTVQSGDLDSDGIALNGTLDANGGTLADDAGNSASTTLNSIGSLTSVLVDAVAPTVSSVSVPANDNYTELENLTFTVNTSENLVVDTNGGTTVPYLVLDIGGVSRQADWTGGSGTSAQTFVYTVQAGDHDTDGISLTSLALNGGTFRDAAGNDLNTTLNSVGSLASVLVDAVAPTVSSVSVPANDTYLAGENLDFTVNYDENVTVNTAGGTPRLALTIGATTRYASYQSGSGTSALVFRHTVQSGDNDSDGIAVNGTLDANGGSLSDGAGNSASTTLNSVGSLVSVRVDAVAPAVSSVSASTADGSYNAGDVIAVTVTFDDSVTVTGTPQLTLETGATDRTVDYTSGSGTATLTFNYTVQAGDTSSDLDYTGTTALVLNGGTINDASGNASTLTLASPGAANSLGANKALVIDTTAPSVTSVSVPASATYVAGQNLDFTVNYDENVTVDIGGGTPRLALTVGATTRYASYQSGSGTSALVFRHTVQSGDFDSDGLALNGTLDANGGTLSDGAGNSASTTLNSIGSLTSVLVDAVAPTVSSVSVPANATYVAGQNLDFTVNYSENITVNTGGGTPRLALTIGATTRYASYQSGSGTSALVFRHTVQAGDLDSDGLTLNGTLDANGGTLSDGAGNSASTTLNSIGSLASVLVDAVAPTVNSVSVPANATYVAGQNLDFTVNYSESITVNTGGGTPRLALTIGATTRYADYLSGSGTSALVFRHTVQSGDNDSDGIAVNATLGANGGTLSDGAGNSASTTLNSIGNLASVLVDAVAPTVSSVSASTADGSYNAGDVIAVTVTFDDSVTVTGTPQLTLETGSTDRTVNYTSGSGTATLTFNYTVQAGDTSSDLDYTATSALALNGGTINDAAGNAATLTLASPGAANSLGANKALVIDTTAPAPAITSAAANPINGSFSATINFGEAVSGFVVGDISASNASLSAFTDNGGGSYSVTVTPTADGAVTLDVAANVAQDSAGNNNTAATQYSNTYDGSAPAPTITSAAANPINGAFSATINFGETVSGFVVGDISASNATLSAFTDNGGGSYSVTVTPTANGAVTLDVTANVAQDTAGNNNTAATQYSNVYDGSAPAPAITSTAANPINGAFSATIDFGEAVSGFVVGDIAAGNATLSAFTDNTGGSYSVTVTPTANGAVTLDVAANVAQDTAGNNNTAATQYSNVYDGSAPAPAITSAAANPINGAFSATINFGEAVSGFVIGDITASNATLSGFTDNTGGSYTITVTPTADGVVTLDVAANVAQDTALNNNTAATQYTNTYDGSAPAPTITSAAANPINGAFTATINFGEAVSGFVVGDISASNASLSAFTDNGGGSYSVTVTPTANGAVTLDVAANVAQDSAGNNNSAATQYTNTYDGSAPAPAITSAAANPINGAFAATIAFGETVSGFAIGDITASNASLSAFSDNGNGNFSFTVTPTANGAVTLNVAAGVATDTAGNSNTAATQYSNTYDGTAPTPVISSTASGATNAPFTATISFGETVSGFVVGDITASNATLSSFSDTGSGNFTVLVMPTADGAVTLNIAANVAQDTASNNNLAATQFSIAYDASAPVLQSSSPADNALDIDPATDIVLTFDENIVAGSGGNLFVAVRATADNSLFESHNVGSSNVTISGNTLTLDLDGSLTPSAGYYVLLGSDAVEDSVGNAFGGIASTTALNFTIANVAPVANDDSATVAEDKSVLINILANDTDADGGLSNASLNIVAAPANGTLSLNTANGAVTYTPAANYHGSDSFTYAVRDVFAALSNTATVSLTVTPVNDAPVAVNDTASTAMGVLVNINVAANDSDIDAGDSVDAATLTLITAPSHGTASIVGGQIRYQPDAGFSGNDSLRYTIADQNSAVSNVAEVFLNVTDSNAVPVANNDSATTNEDTFVVIDVLANDTDSDGSIDASSVKQVVAPAHGALAINSTTGAITYTPAANYAGADSFTYLVADDQGNLSSVATVTVTINAVNDAPVAQADNVMLADSNPALLNVLGNDSDVDGTLAVASVQVVGAATAGTTSVDGATGAITYTPTSFSGSDSFTYRVQDNTGVWSAPATVTLSSSAFNSLPLANDDARSIDEDGSANIAVVANDQDLDGSLDLTSLTITTSPALGNATVNGDGSITYTAHANANGSDSFQYTIDDNVGGVSNTATVTVLINAVNDAPTIAGTPSATVLAGVAYSFTPTLGDIEGDTLRVTAANLPGWATLNPSTGAISGTPARDDEGAFSNIVLTVSDGIDTTALGSFAIAVQHNDDLDSDTDGIPDDIEIDNELDPDDAADAVLDADSDGISNLDEHVAGSDLLNDDYAPVFGTLDVIEINATGLWTRRPTLTEPVAVDGLDGNVTATLVSGAELLEPGVHTLTWSVTDAAGNSEQATQELWVWPQISLSKDQVRGEGAETTIRFLLNGVAPEYPLTVGYTLSGTADSADHDLTERIVTFETGETEQLVEFSVIDDNVTEGEEVLQVNLDSATTTAGAANFGAKAIHALTITEENFAPNLVLRLQQNGQDVRIVSQDGGVVTVTATVNDPNPGDTHDYEWVFPSGMAVTHVDDRVKQIDPSTLAVRNWGIGLMVTDNGSPELATLDSIKFTVIPSVPPLSDEEDTDGDGIDDETEGLGDADEDGQPDYLDAVSLPNVLNEQSGDNGLFLIEADPGVHLTLGDRALAKGGAGARLDDTDFSQPDPDFDNVGGYFDMTARNVPSAGASVNIVIPQRAEIPSSPQYRKLINGRWRNFVENARNALASAPGEAGVCPPAGDAAYVPGLTPGHWCVQLTIEDGGPNDADGEANGTVEDPGGVSQNLATANTARVDGGGGALGWELLLLLCLPLLRGRRVLLFGSALLAALPVQAEGVSGEGGQWYAQAVLGQVDANWDKSGFERSLDGFVQSGGISELDDSRVTAELLVGYHYNDKWSAELGWLDWGETDLQVDVVTNQTEVLRQLMRDDYPLSGQGPYLGARYNKHVALSTGKTVTFFAKAGAWFWEGDYRIRVGNTSENVNRDGVDLMVGAGFSMPVHERFDVGLLMQHVNLDNDRQIQMGVHVTCKLP